MGQFKKRLKGLGGDVWNDQRNNPSNGFEEYPDGYYNVELASAEIRESSNGNLGIAIRWTITDEESDYDGKTIFHWLNLESSEGALGVTMSTLRRLGCEVPEDPSGLEDVISDLDESSLRVRLQLKTKGEFQNKNVTRVYESDDEENEDAPFDEGVEDDETPAPDGEDEETGEEDVSDDDSDGDEGDEEVELKEGMSVSVFGKGSGVVRKIDEENGLAMVKLDKGKRAIRVPFDQIFVDEDSDEE